MDQVVNESLADDRFATVLFAAFAGVALLLAMIGIYGVMSFAVAQRTQEIALRMAVGAAPDKCFSGAERGHAARICRIGLGLGGTYFVGRACGLFCIRSAGLISHRSEPWLCALGGRDSRVLSPRAASHAHRSDGRTALRMNLSF